MGCLDGVERHLRCYSVRGLPHGVIDCGVVENIMRFDGDEFYGLRRVSRFVDISAWNVFVDDSRSSWSSL